MAVQTFQVDGLNIKKEIDEEEEELLPTDSVFNSNLEPIKTVKQEGVKQIEDNLQCESDSEDEPDISSVKQIEDNLKCEDESEDEQPDISCDKRVENNLKCEDESEAESEDEKPDVSLLNTFINSKCKLEDESDSDGSNDSNGSDNKSLIFPKSIKTEPLYPVEEKTINKDSSDEEFIPITKEVKKDVDLSTFYAEENCYDIKNDNDSSKDDCVVEMSNVNDLHLNKNGSPRRKRKHSTDHSDDNTSDPVEEFNDNSPMVKRKRVHFAEEGSIKSTRIFERAKKPITFVPSNKEPGVGILKNKVPSGKTDDQNSAVSNNTKQKKKAKTVRNRKEGKKTKSMSETDVINKKSIREINKAKEPSRGKKNNTLNKNTETSSSSRITDFFNKKNKDPNKTQLDSREKTETNGSSEMESLETVNGKNQKKNESNEKKNNESQKENIVADCTARNIYKHCQKRKSKAHYAFKCPVLAYLCLCGAWCKSGPELNAHLSVCAKLQPSVVLTRLKL